MQLLMFSLNYLGLSVLQPKPESLQQLIYVFSQFVKQLLK